MPPNVVSKTVVMSDGVPIGTVEARPSSTIPVGERRGRTILISHLPTLVLPTLFDLACLTLFWLFFFWEILVRKDHLIPYDLIDQHYMFQVFIHRALMTGQSPWWTTNIMAGYPIAADPLSALFYPPNLAMHLLVRSSFLPYIAMEWQLALHFLWAAFGTYALARLLTGSRAGSILAALTFAFGAFFTWHIPHLSPVSTYSWLPWILFAYLLAIRRRSLVWTALAAVAFGCMALAGHALTILLVGYLLLGLIGIVAWQRWSSDRRGAVVCTAIGFAILALGSGLAMVQLLPSWTLSGLTDRANFTYEAATGSSYLPHWLLTLVIPNFFGDNGPAKYWASGDIAETNIYAGLLPLFLAGLAVARARAWDRKITALLLGGALLALVVSFGSAAWPYHIAFDILPGVARVRRPLDVTACFQLAIGLLAAFGITRIARDARSISSDGCVLTRWLKRALIADLAIIALCAVALATTYGGPAQRVLITITNGVVFAGFIILAALAVMWAYAHRQISTRLALALIVLVAAIDLGSANADVVYAAFERAPNSYIGPNWAGVTTDQIVPLLQSSQVQALPARFRYYPDNAGSIWENGPLVWNVDSAWGYSVLWPSDYQQLLNAAVADPSSPLFDLLDIRYVISSNPIEKNHPSINTSKFKLIYDHGPLVYENLDVGPRVWVAGKAVVQPAASVLSYMQQHAGSLSQTVVLSEPPPAAAASTASAGTATITRYDNTRVDIRADLRSAGFVVLGDTYYPGWRVAVDGKPAKLYRADEAVRAVYVPAGNHQISYHFTLPGLRLGAIATLLSLIGIIALLLVGLLLMLWPRRRTISRASDRLL